MKSKILKIIAGVLFLLILIALGSAVYFQHQTIRSKDKEIKNLNETVEKLTKENEELMAGKGAAEDKLNEAQEKITSLEQEVANLKKK